MTATSAVANMTNEEKANRHRQLKQVIEAYSKMLAHIYTIMPHTGYVIKDGTIETLPPLPEWQKRINKVIEMRDECIKFHFPEFYSSDNDKI